MKSYPLDEDQLRKTLKRDAKALGIAPGAAKIFIDEALKSTIAIVNKKKIITAHDLTRTLVKELKKYNRDLAYVYQNRDKII